MLHKHSVIVLQTMPSTQTIHPLVFRYCVPQLAPPNWRGN